MLRAILTSIIAASVVAGCATNRASSERKPSSAVQTKAPFPIPSTCQKFIESLPADYKFGWVANKEDASRTDLPPVYTFYYHRPTEGLTPTAFFNGGPAIDSRRLYEEFGQKEGMWPVFIDQRGTGCSSLYPNGREAFDYLQWSSEGIARDAEEVRKALNVTKWNIFGQSYGAIIVHRYLEKFPEALSIVVAHGGTSLGPLEDVQLRAEQQLLVISKYLSIFPSDRQNVIDIVREELCDPSGRVCGLELVQRLAVRNLGYTFFWTQLHAGFESIVKNPVKKSARNPSQAADEPFVHPVTLANAKKMIELADMGVYNSVNCVKVTAQALALLKDRELLALSECGHVQTQEGFPEAFIEGLKANLATFNVTRIDVATIRKNLEKNPAIKFYLFSSELDYFAPAGSIKLAADRMGPRVQYKELKSVGHEAFLTVPEVLQPLINEK